MITAHCSNCKKTIYASDEETNLQILDRLAEHMTQCPQAAFTYDADTNAGEKRISGLQGAIDDVRRKVR
jgi:hypothetical protein